MSLTTSQTNALSRLVKFCRRGNAQNMVTVRGPAGTGKTYLVARLLDSPELRDKKVAVVAPTNKAVRVLWEKLHQDGLNVPCRLMADKSTAVADQAKQGLVLFGSLHALLGLRLVEKEDGTQAISKDGYSKAWAFDLIVVDESSMVSDFLFEVLMESREGTKTVFVGDPFQLPPVGSSSESQAFTKVKEVLELTEIVRQAEGNPIIAMSKAIRDMIAVNQRITPESLQGYMPFNPEYEIPLSMYRNRDGFIPALAIWGMRDGKDVRVMCYTNAAVLRYNSEIHRLIHGETETAFVGGQKAIIHQQSPLPKRTDGKVTGLDVLLTSEEVSIIEVVKARRPNYSSIPAMKVYIERDDGTSTFIYVAEDQAAVAREVSRQFGLWREAKAAHRDREAREHSDSAWALQKAFTPLRHAYAMTAHKAQGSTFDSAIVDFADLWRIPSTYDFNRALYVTNTRPRSTLAICV